MANWGDNFRRGSVSLRIIGPTGALKVFSLEGGGLKIGSARDAELILDDPHVAPQHCRIVRRNDAWILIDHGAPTGTTINLRRCIEPTPLAEGDRIGVGSHIIEVAPARLQIDPQHVADKVRHGAGPWTVSSEESDAEQRERLAQYARAWDAQRRPRRLLPDAERLQRAILLDAHTPLASLTRAWVLVAVAGRRRRQGASWLAAGGLIGILAARGILGSGMPSVSLPSAEAEASQPEIPGPAPPKTTTPRPSPGALRTIQHEVIPGETLDQIAATYAVLRSWIEDWNPTLQPGQPLRPGTILRIITDQTNAVRRERHCVTLPAAESWDSLARRLNTDVTSLRGHNPQLSDRLRPGDVVTTFVRKQAAEQVPVERAAPQVADEASSRGKPTSGAVVDQGLAPLPFSPYYDLRCPYNAFASSHAITHLLAGITNLRSGYDGQIIIGDLSREEGGPLGPHASHQTGRDVDIWLPVLGGCYRALPTCKGCSTLWCRPEPDEIDWAATWELIAALQATGTIQNIFLDRSLHDELRAGARAAGVPVKVAAVTIRSEPGVPALVTHSNFHTQHIHVRFRCGPLEPGCID